MSDKRNYCCEENLEEPMAGTAEPVDVWVMLEYRPPWPARALEECTLDGDTRRWLDDNLAALTDAGYRARPQFIRRPDDPVGRVRLLVGVAGRLLVHEGDGYGFLTPLDLLAMAREPDAYPQDTRPHYFVCTNGQRDLCCARFGLPAFAALRERVPERVWQVTHLGGHRFAPNVLVLPQGALYGRVAPGRVDEFVDAVEGGALAFPHLRGRTGYAPAVQAAEALAGRSDLTVAEVSGDEVRTRVTFRGDGGPVAVAVRRADEPLPVRKSCADDSAKPVYPFRAD